MFFLFKFFNWISNTNSKRQELLIDELKKSNIKYEFGKLNIGDFTWIARSRTGETKELVLDYIIERKRVDDLVQSIIDGRYKEQKVI
jgi:crossover junction endonuclease MUS81